MKPSILIVDDHSIVREGLQTLLLSKLHIEKIDQASDGLEALSKVKNEFYDYVIMDISMPNMNGIEATKEILCIHPKTKILTLSMHSDKHYVLESLKAGAKAFLLKDCAFEELIIALKTVKEGKLFLSAKINDIVIQDFMTQSGQITNEKTAFQLLTPREREVLKLLAEGNSTKDMANKLELSIKTIENHRQQIMEKLDIHSIAELTKYAIKEGLTSL